MRALLVARKSLLELLREWQLLLLVLLVPLVFLGILAVGYNTPLLVTHPVLVANSAPQAEPLIEEWAAQRYADGRPVFDITETANLDAAETALKDQTATALIILSTNQETESNPPSTQYPIPNTQYPISNIQYPISYTLTIKGDALYMRFYRASTILESVATRYADRVAGRPEIVDVVQQPLLRTGSGQARDRPATGPRSEFDLYTPGMIVFALMLIIPQTAMLVARELRWDTLRRLRLTPMHAWDLLGGISIAQMAVAVFQVVAVFVSALLIGFHNQGSLLVAVVVGLAVSFSAIGQGLLVACFVENDSQAINVGSAVAMMQVWFSGSFYQLPPMTVFTLAGHQIDLFDVFPATHGFLALQQVLSYGAGLNEIAFRLAATLVLSLVYFALGVLVFQRLKMRESA